MKKKTITDLKSLGKLKVNLLSQGEGRKVCREQLVILVARAKRWYQTLQDVPGARQV